MTSEEHKMYKAGMLKAFTLTEMMVSLLICAILGSLIAGLFTTLTESMKEADRKASEQETILIAEQIISGLVDAADSIHCDDLRLILYSDDEAKEICFYNDTVVLLSDTNADTLKITTGNITCFSDPDANTLVNKIMVPVIIMDQTIVLTFTKDYEGETVVKYQMGNDEV